MTNTNAYFRVTVKPLADGSFEAISFKKLRNLDPEVKRVYENGVPHIRLHCGEILLAGYGSTLQWKPPMRIFQRDFDLIHEAHARLLAVEANVEEYATRQIDLYVGGAAPKTTTYQRDGKLINELMRVVDCRHSDGSVYSWRIKEDDTTEYKTGDIVEAEHLGCRRNEYLPVVRVRTLRCDETSPVRKVVRLFGKQL